MFGIFDSKRDGSGAGPGRFSVGGSDVTCSHCGGQEFEERSALLNTPGMTLIDLDWADKQANLLLCSRCGHIQWFLHEPTRIGPAS